MLENKKEIVNSNIVVKRRSENNDKRVFKNNVFIYSFITAFVSLVLFVCFLLFSNESRIFDITVSGNCYFEDEDILEIANINDNFFLNIPFLVENRIKNHPLIDNVRMSFLDGKVINIDVIEKKLVGYRQNNDGYFEIVTSTNETYVLKDNELYMIANVPMIDEIVDEEKSQRFCRLLGELDKDIIREISEVKSYPFSYDPDMFEFVMSDGNYCFASLYDIDKISEYYSISFNLDQDEGHACIYIGDFTISAYSSTCPWQEQ